MKIWKYFAPSHDPKIHNGGWKVKNTVFSWKKMKKNTNIWKTVQKQKKVKEKRNLPNTCRRERKKNYPKIPNFWKIMTRARKVSNGQEKNRQFFIAFLDESAKKNILKKKSPKIFLKNVLQIFLKTFPKPIGVVQFIDLLIAKSLMLIIIIEPMWGRPWFPIFGEWRHRSSGND